MVHALDILWTSTGIYKRIGYANESEFERAAKPLRLELFGPMGVYLDIKKPIGLQGGIKSVPDAFLIDLHDDEPRLYLVEFELQKHSLVNHIVRQIMDFRDSFSSDRHKVNEILNNAIERTRGAKTKCSAYIKRHGIRSIDRLLNKLIYEKSQVVLVVIDQSSPEFVSQLRRNLTMDILVIELLCYQKSSGEVLYRFEPLHESSDRDDTVLDSRKGNETRPASADDTVIIPLKNEDHWRVFLDERQSPPIRISEARRPYIKWAAAYRIGSQPGVTHIARVANVEQDVESTKQVLKFKKPARRILPKKRLPGSRERALLTHRYASYETFKKAKTFDDIWPTSEEDLSEPV